MLVHLLAAVALDTANTEHYTLVKYAVQRAAQATGAKLRLVDVVDESSEKSLCESVMAGKEK